MKTAFKAHHIPEGLLERKLNEFLALTQGTRDVLHYAQAFNDLCRYADRHAVDTRTAVYMLAIDRVAYDTRVRGIYA